MTTLMKTTKKATFFVLLTIMMLFSSQLLADSTVWGYFKDTDEEYLLGDVYATSVGYSDSVGADGYYVIGLPAGNYTLRGECEGYADAYNSVNCNGSSTYQRDLIFDAGKSASGGGGKNESARLPYDVIADGSVVQIKFEFQSGWNQIYIPQAPTTASIEKLFDGNALGDVYLEKCEKQVLVKDISVAGIYWIYFLKGVKVAIPISVE